MPVRIFPADRPAPYSVPVAAPSAPPAGDSATPPPVGRRSRRRAALSGGILALLLTGGMVAALSADADAAAGGGQAPEPTLLNADQVVYDEQAGIVTATGTVELSHGGRTVRADKIVYNRNTKVVVATGDVRMRETTGDFFFTNYAELTDDLRDAFVENVRVLMTDNSRIVGNEGERRGGRIFRVNRGIYSPCELCKEDPTNAPVWQLRASRVVHDKEEQEVRYRDVFLEMFGIPVLYSPYFSHPDPSVKRRSGFLTPTYGNKSDLGAFIRSQYYWDIAPDQDMTFDTGIYTKQVPLLGGEYRKRFENGRLQLNGALTRSELFGLNKVNKGEKFRGFIAAKGLYELDDIWRVGIDAVRASDTSFLRRYYGVRENVLTSRAYVEGFNGRNYAAVDAYAFQDTRLGNGLKEPVILPRAIYSAFGEPGGTLGGRWSLEAQALGLRRDAHSGVNVNRLSIQPGWRREDVSSLGFVTWADVSALGSFYSYTNYDRPDIAGTQQYDATKSRFQPRGSVGVRYPFVSFGEKTQQTLEPKLVFSYAPELKNDVVPNEDSLDVSLDSTTLFMSSRYAGIDRLDTGAQATYGVRWAINGYKEGAASVFLGQASRLNKDTDYPAYSGLNRKQSDYVTRLTLQPASWLDVDYRGRFASLDGRAQVHSLTTAAGTPGLNGFVNFYYRDRSYDTSRTTLIHSSYMTVGGNVALAPHWTLSVGHSQAFSSDPGPRTALGVLNYNDECLLFQTILRRDFTTESTSSSSSSSTGDEGSTLYFRLVFKNLGEFISPSFGSLLFGSTANSSSTTK